MGVLPDLWSDPLGLPITGGKNLPITEAATFANVTLTRTW